MNIRFARYAVAGLLVLAVATPAAADNSSPVVFKLGSYLLFDDSAAQNFGTDPKIAAGFEYPLQSLAIGSAASASAYFDFASASGRGGGTSLLSSGIVERFRLARVRGIIPYIGFGVGANFNTFDLAAQRRFHQLSFAQKALLGVVRPDGRFYEIYFRAAPQNSGNITSGLGISYGLHL